ncbi:MAG: sugar phosphate isomerase/epimerase [Rudanella sp.]|nr:sugar phosphate isomerase/epimerase [Rudanella sp.]
MNKLGMNLFVWTMGMDEDMSETLMFLQKTGFDFVEMPVGGTNNRPADLLKWQQLGQQARQLGLGVQTCSILSPELSLIHADPAIRQAGIDYLKHVVDCSAAAGSTILMGPLYAGFKAFTGKPATAEEWTWSVEAMREVAQHAQTKDVTLAIESLNRFEIYLLTCADDVVRYIEAVNHPNCRAAFDTFHANMEEKNVPDALRKLAPYLVHVQMSENDRSTPGRGQINFKQVFDTLNEIGYTGPIAIEAFGPTPPELAAATHIFRPMFTSPEQLAVDGFNYLKQYD